MAKVTAYTDKTTGEMESAESLIRRFKKKVADEGTLLEVRKYEYYRTKAEKRKEKSLKAARFKK